MIEGFAHERRTYRGRTRDVFIAGEGPVIVVMHEVPGLHPSVVAFGRKLVTAGFQVWMPSLFGEPGRAVSVRYTAGCMARACVSREFTVWATRRNSPITDWLRDLSREAHDRTGRPVGAVGMCITGGFALAMMVDAHLVAPVLSQPSLPIAVRSKQRRDLGIDDETLAVVRRRCEEGACVLGLRFSGDRMVPDERFARLREELGDRFLSVEIDSRLRNASGIPPWHHSVLAQHAVDRPGHPTREAFDQVVVFFRERLGVSGAGGGR